MGKKTHGMYLHPLYSSWTNMKTRCYNQKANGYHNYGGRNILVCNLWLNDINLYIKHMLGLENSLTPGYSPDRIKNDENYEPGNMRWANRRTQNINKRVYKNNSSGYVGVYLDKESGKFKAQIAINKKYKSIGRFPNILEAATARDWFIVKAGLWEHQLQIIRT